MCKTSSEDTMLMSRDSNEPLPSFEVSLSQTFTHTHKNTQTQTHTWVSYLWTVSSVTNSIALGRFVRRFPRGAFVHQHTQRWVQIWITQRLVHGNTTHILKAWIFERYVCTQEIGYQWNVYRDTTQPCAQSDNEWEQALRILRQHWLCHFGEDYFNLREAAIK